MTSTFNRCSRDCSFNAVNRGSSNSIVCCLPSCVCEFSSSLQRFENQISRNVLAQLQRRCVAVPTPVPPVPPPQPVVLSITTRRDQTLLIQIALSVQAISITSVTVSLANVVFEIVGFSSVIVRISGDVIVNTQYIGIDSEVHTDTQVVPFSFLETIPGTFPPNVIVEGSLAIVNQILTITEDPSTLAITGATLELFFQDTIIILLPPA